MSGPSLDEQIRNPESALVRDALTRKCEVCRVASGVYCANTMPLGGLLAEAFGRLVHLARTSP